ncbi:hypothetical protein BJX63DRAFT_338614 [Aspergillus granulosus]|uniref:F-box domain-containing protein n=1 Tax=Aspergillus granulosus TaxID=176169 RepID=A0ABR4HX91_9EURO
MARQTLSVDAWNLVFENATKEDLCNLCLVSRTFNTIATGILYRSISLIGPDPNPNQMWSWHPDKQTEEAETKPPNSGHWHLLRRLEDDTDDTVRNYVQNLVLSSSKGPRELDQEFLSHLLKDNRLCKLIGRLPNLRKVTLTMPDLQTESIICAINRHSRKPELILSIENGGRSTFGNNLLPCVTNLKVSVSPFDESDGENRRVLAVQKLLFNCPNVRSLALTIRWKYGGCIVSSPRYPITTSFRLTGTETFPPIEDLSLNGYRMGDDEWAHWRDRFDWSKLSSLTLGPQNTLGILGRLAGYATSLTTLKTCSYAGDRSEDRAGLSSFLSSFDTLKALELKGFICSIDAIAQHKNLETLCLHEDESSRAGKPRTVLTAEELDYLDRECPDLRILKVDITRGDNKMPTDVLTKLATGFKNLQSLSIHFELGLPDIKHPITPTLNYASVRSISQSFFDERKKSSIDITNSYTLILWTGNCYRRWPQWEPPYASFEKKFTATYEVRLPDGGSEVEVRHLQKDRLDSFPEPSKRNAFGDYSSYEFSRLRTQVGAAVEGPTEALMQEVGV